MRLTSKSAQLARNAQDYGLSLAQDLETRKLHRTDVFTASDSVTTWLHREINKFNERLDTKNYQDTWK